MDGAHEHHQALTPFGHTCPLFYRIQIPHVTTEISLFFLFIGMSLVWLAKLRQPKKYSKINRKVNNIHTHFEFFYYQNHILLSIVATWINEITEIPLENPYRTLT